MSPIGKTFVVLNALLSALFLGWAANVLATSQDYKQQHEDLQAEYDAKVDEMEAAASQLKTELNQTREEKDRYRNDAEAEKGRADQAESELADAKLANQQLRGRVDGIESELGNLNSSLTSISAAKDRAVDRSLDLERERNEAVQLQNEAERSLRDAQDEARRASQRADDLQADLESALAEVDDLQMRFQTVVDATGVDLARIFAQPLIEGAVLNVKLDLAPGLIAINRGSDHGVQPGMTFEIYRGNVYKGKVRVQNVRPTMCSALVTLAADGTQMAQGDSASTRIL